MNEPVVAPVYKLNLYKTPSLVSNLRALHGEIVKYFETEVIGQRKALDALIQFVILPQFSKTQEKLDKQKQRGLPTHQVIHFPGPSGVGNLITKH